MFNEIISTLFLTRRNLYKEGPAMVQRIQNIHPEMIKDFLRTDDVSVERATLAYEIVELASITSKEVESLQLALVFGTKRAVKAHLNILASGDFSPFEGTSPESGALIIEFARKLVKKYELIEALEGSSNTV